MHVSAVVQKLQDNNIIIIITHVCIFCIFMNDAFIKTYRLSWEQNSGIFTMFVRIIHTYVHWEYYVPPNVARLQAMYRD